MFLIRMACSQVWLLFFFRLNVLCLMLCQNEKNLTYVQHPKLPQYFDDISKYKPQLEAARSLIPLTKLEKVAKCQGTLAAVVYRSQPLNQNLLPALNPDTQIYNLLNDVRDLYKRKLLKGIELVEVTLQLPSRIVLVPALPCILDHNFSWFITSGFQVNEFFVLEKEADDEHFHVHGISEPEPEVEKNISLNQLQIELHFLKNYRSAVYKTKKKHFCDLENIQRLRLCCSAHIAWRQMASEEIFRVNSAYEDAGTCIENAVLWFEKISQENTGFTESIEINLVGCAINTTLTEPQFYLAADQNDSNAAYVLQKRYTENREVVYKLFLYLTDIPSLQKETEIIQTFL